MSKFFYGGYTMADRVTIGYGHSNYARKVASSLAVAVLQRVSSHMRTKVKEDETLVHNGELATFALHNIREGKRCDGIKAHYPDVRFFGKHYLTRYEGNDPVTGKPGFKSNWRHYTIANCMHKRMHAEFIRTLDEVLLAHRTSGGDANIHDATLFDQELLRGACKSSSFASMTVKNYHQPYGVSPLFFNKDAKNNGTWIVKGPVGKGLGVTRESKGVHMAFTAGTGILVFMDLVMRIYLTLLGALPKEEMLHPEFRFVLYASF